MRLYICTDGSFAGTQADAKAKGRGFTEEDVPTDKAGLIAYLNGLVFQAGQASMLDLDVVPTGSTFDTPPPPPPAPSALLQSISLDEQFDRLPLAHQLHFAATAMENARQAIKTA